MTLTIWVIGGAVALVGGFVWSLTRLPRTDGIPMNSERRQMMIDREQRDRLGAL